MTERPWDELRDDWEALTAAGDAVPGSELADSSAQLRAGGGVPESLSGATLIVHGPVGTDPAVALAVAAAARMCPQLAVVVAAGETGIGDDGRGARLARQLLDQVGRPDVVVAVGAVAEEPDHYAADVEPAQDDVPTVDWRSAVARTVPANGPVRWLGLGALTNLASVVEQAPALARRLYVTQLVAPADTVRRDLNAVRTVVAAADGGDLAALELVGPDVSAAEPLRITGGGQLYRSLTAPDAPGWARMLGEHAHGWFQRHGGHARDPALSLMPAVALASALDLPFVDSDLATVTVTDSGLTAEPDETGRIWWTESVDGDAFLRWVGQALDPAS